LEWRGLLLREVSLKKLEEGTILGTKDRKMINVPNLSSAFHMVIKTDQSTNITLCSQHYRMRNVMVWVCVCDSDEHTEDHAKLRVGSVLLLAGVDQ